MYKETLSFIRRIADELGIEGGFYEVISAMKDNKYNISFELEAEIKNFLKLQNIERVKDILNTKQINNHTLFNYGSYLNLVAGEILNIDKTLINKMYKELPIKSMKDIDITGKDIMILLNIEPSKKISTIINDLKVKILNGNLKNKKSELKKYILRTYKDE